MKRLGNELLAGARLAENQNGTVGAGDATDERAQ
jgi:hypothetical protein